MTPGHRVVVELCSAAKVGGLGFDPQWLATLFLC